MGRTEELRQRLKRYENALETMGGRMDIKREDIYFVKCKIEQIKDEIKQLEGG